MNWEDVSDDKFSLMIREAKDAWLEEFGDVAPIESFTYDPDERAFILNQEGSLLFVRFSADKVSHFHGASDEHLRNFAVVNDGFSVVWDEPLDIYFTVKDLLEFVAKERES